MEPIDSLRPVVVADGDEGERRKLEAALRDAGFDVLGVATGDAALALARKLEPALFILEIPLGRLSGYEVCRALREDLKPGVPIIFVSGVRIEPYDRVAGLLIGADDYVVKPYAIDELLARVRRLTDNGARSNPARLVGLTPRESEVLDLIAEGLTPRQIAERLVISTRTVSTHIEHVLKKLGVKSRSQAVALAYREGLVPSRPKALS